MALVLLVTAVIKLVSALGSAGMLNSPDPILMVPNRWLYALVALVELGVAWLTFRPELQLAQKLVVIGWLGCGFVIYRIGLLLSETPSLCPCLGNAADWWPWLSYYQSTITMTITGLLLFSFVLLGYLYLVRKQAHREAVDFE